MSEVGYSKCIEFVLRGVLISTDVHIWIDEWYVCLVGAHLKHEKLVSETHTSSVTKYDVFFYTVFTVFWRYVTLPVMTLPCVSSVFISWFKEKLTQKWTLCSFKPLWLSFLHGTQIKKFWKMFMLPFFIQWKWMGTGAPNFFGAQNLQSPV